MSRLHESAWRPGPADDERFMREAVANFGNEWEMTGADIDMLDDTALKMQVLDVDVFLREVSTVGLPALL